MLPIVDIPKIVRESMKSHRKIFCREEGFGHIQGYVSGLLLSPNKTLQGIYGQLVCSKGKKASRRAMHEAVFEAGWDVEELMKSHRKEISKKHKGKRRGIISIDWTLAHHDYSEKIYGAKHSYDYVEKRMGTYQTVMTAAVANRERVDGVAVEVQYPKYQAEEKAYLEATVKEQYQQMWEVRKRIEELLYYQKNRLSYRKRTEMAVEIVKQIEAEGNFPKADYAFDNGVLSLALTQLIEKSDKNWVSEIESSRQILWQDQWQRVDEVGTQLRKQYPKSFRLLDVKKRNGEIQRYWVFTKCIRLKKYGRKQLVIVHEREDLSQQPRFLLTSARHSEPKRVIQTWELSMAY